LYDFVIKNGRINTGAGNPWFRGDVGIIGDKIVEVGRITDTAGEVLDAEGLMVSPGFIDLHDHSDFTILVNREADNKIHMGVSTIVYSSCGSGAAPLNEEMRKEIRRQAPYLSEAGVEANWSTMEEYLSLVESHGISINVAPLVGFGTVRKYVIGMEMRDPTPGEMEAMKGELVKAMEAGCRGMATGLRYDPQSYAKTGEVIELSKVIAEKGGIYASHIRDEGDRGDPVGAIEEIIEIGREAGLPVNISHFKVLSKQFWDICPKLIEMIEEARGEGVRITADQYPYRASGTGLQAWIPKWANEGGDEELVRRLGDPEVYDEIKKGLGESMEDRGGPEAALISSYPLNTELVGMNISEAAEERCEEPLETAMQLLKEHVEAIIDGEIKGGFSIVNFNQKEENVEMIMRQPWVAIGTDGRIHSPDTILNKHIPAPHPRFYGTFPRVLGRYVHEKGVINLNDAIRKMTSLPAKILGLKNRGLLMPGYHADLTIFNPDTVIDRANYAPKEETKLFPEGIIHLLVNGVITMKDGKHTGARAGKILRK
jgi:N-acyl-D-amino-acid deacylase